MFKKMLATTAITTLLAMPAFAQDTMNPDEPVITDDAPMGDDAMDAPVTDPGFDDPAMDDPMIDDPMIDDPAMDTDPPAAATDPVDDPLASPDGATLLADDVIGADLVNLNDERIATVDDAVLSPGGEVETVLVDVGGFLGFGARTVAIPAADLTLETGENGEPILRTTLTQEELENLPEYEAEDDWVDTEEM